MHQLKLLNFKGTLCRIVRVDLRFPSKPVISAAAKDLICQVAYEFCLYSCQIIAYVACFAGILVHRDMLPVLLGSGSDSKH